MIIKYIDKKGHMYVRDVVSARVEDNIIYIDMYAALNRLKITCKDITTCIDITNQLYYDGRSDVSSMDSVIVEEVDYDSDIQDYLNNQDPNSYFDIISFFGDSGDDYDDDEADDICFE